MTHPPKPATAMTSTLRAMRGRPKGGLGASPGSRTEEELCLRGLADAFLSRMSARAYAPGSVEAHGWALKYFIDWAVSRRLLVPSAFTRPLLEEYQLYLHRFRSERTGAPLAVNTQLARLGVIRRFFAWLCRENILPANPAADLDLPRKQARLLPKSLALEEIDRLLALPDLSSPFGARDRALLELFYATGVRRTEMVRLELGDFDPAQRTLHVRRGKNGKSRLLPVGGHAAAWLDRYVGVARPQLAFLPAESALFLSGYGTPFSPVYLGNWVAKQMRKAGTKKGGACHLFRHSCATDMHRGGADIRHVQEMLGHARLDTTQIYTHVSIAALQEVHTRCHPRGGEPAKVPDHSLPKANATDAMPEIALPPDPAAPLSSRLASAPAAPARNRPDDESPSGGAPATPIEPEGPNPPPSGTDGNFATSESTDGAAIDETCYGYRYLDSQLGRWLSRDPIGENESINGYLFVENNGPQMADLFGLMRLIEKGRQLKERECGAFTLSRSWWIEDIKGELSNGKSAYLIQNVTITVLYAVDCNGQDLGIKSDSFSEYWGPIREDGKGGLRLPELEKGQKPELQQLPDDHFESPSWGKSCGAFVIEASAAVYVLDSKPSGYKVTGKPPSGPLPHRDKYIYTGKANSNIAYIRGTVNWNCCP